MIVLLLALLGHLDAPQPLLYRCDVLEINHVYDDQARPVLVQVMGWRQCVDGLHCQWWVRCDPHYLPVLDDQRVSMWIYGRSIFGSADQLIRVEAPSFRETWTQWDREAIDRASFQPASRAGLPHSHVPELPTN